MAMSANAKESILEAARLAAQLHGYGGLNFRDLAADVGIKGASIYYHFASKADLGAAVARRYWEDTAAGLDAMLAEAGDPLVALDRYPDMFRTTLHSDNRLCLASFLAAEAEDLPEVVKTEVLSFADINIAWLSKVMKAAKVAVPEGADQRARAIYTAIAGAQLIARSRADISLYDAVVDSYRAAGLLPQIAKPAKAASNKSAPAKAASKKSPAQKKTVKA